uniref:HAMP domain-containing protein n=1 Tax=Candidatus Merdicola sp. TaxID=3085652 RepID=UPI003FED43BF
MIKNIQLKIVLIFFILGMFIIIGLGLFFTNSLEAINTALNTAQITDVIIEEINNIKTISMISLVLLGAISIIVGIFLSKTVVKPIDKLIKNAEKLTSKEKNAHVKNKNEIDNLADTFEEMTTKLQANLSEISTQKKQMETILLHMSDGIIAFNMEGKVILINPAATRALSIMEEDT